MYLTQQVSHDTIDLTSRQQHMSTTTLWYRRRLSPCSSFPCAILQFLSSVRLTFLEDFRMVSEVISLWDIFLVPWIFRLSTDFAFLSLRESGHLVSCPFSTHAFTSSRNGPGNSKTLAVRPHSPSFDIISGLNNDLETLYVLLLHSQLI